jgi:phage/conjugal plasmid C-4 type zinc finger TraR family protein
MSPDERAQELELAEYVHNQAKAILPEPDAPSKKVCVDCDGKIPKARREAVQGCTRCVDCQTTMERDAK